MPRGSSASRAVRSPGNAPDPSAWSKVMPQSLSRWLASKSPKYSTKPASRSTLVTSRYTGKLSPSSARSSSRRCSTASACCSSSTPPWIRSGTLTVTITPLIGCTGR